MLSPPSKIHSETFLAVEQEGLSEERVERDGALVALPVDAERDRALLDLLVADDQDERDLLDLGLADLLADLLAAEVDGGAQAGRFHLLRERLRVRLVALGDRQDDGLDGGQPEGEAPVVVLDEDAEEALERAEQGPVDHVGPVLLAVLA